MSSKSWLNLFGVRQCPRKQIIIMEITIPVGYRASVYILKEADRRPVSDAVSMTTMYIIT
jgi:hypothetical protein